MVEQNQKKDSKEKDQAKIPKKEKQRGHRISKVNPGSIAEELEIQVGDRLISIDGHEIKDVLDYRFYVNSESMILLVEKPDGEEWEYEIEHDYEDIGIDFDSGLMSDYKTCTNKCVFCFIDQMPPGMRETLYFKDDDSRLSFLQGNYVTLTNMKQSDIERIIAFKLAPINISVHTTNPELRKKMLHNRFAGDSLKYLDVLYQHNIPMNGQIVLCKGWNDGEELRRSLEDLLKLAPVMESVSVVPLGMTKFRDGLEKMNRIDKQSARDAIDMIEHYQKLAMDKCNRHFVHASDEFYLLADRELPTEDRYDGYIQLENGVGMLRLLIEEVRDALLQLRQEGIDFSKEKKQEISIATGRLPAQILKMLIKEVEEVMVNTEVHLYPIRNDFFGEDITVSGLVTGTDLMKQLKGVELGSRLLLPINMFRSNEEVFLDDYTRMDVEQELGVDIVKVASSGYDFVNAIRYRDYVETRVYSHYEPSDAEFFASVTDEVENEF